MAKAPATVQNSASPQDINRQQRAAVLAYAIDESINIFSTTFTPPNTGAIGQVINIPLRNVGLVKKFVILVHAVVSVGGAETQTLTKWGPANFFSQFLLTDLQNQTRINTTGWHLMAVASAKRNSVFGAAFTNDNPGSFGNENTNVISAPSSMVGAGNHDVYMAFEIPVAYSDNDLTGAIYANVLNATWNLALTVNPNLFVPTTGDPVQAMYQSSTAVLGNLVSWDIQVYQHFLDQLPVDSNGNIIVPMLDTSIMYRLENTVQTALVANQEQAIPYANFRQFLSTLAIYDNNGVLTPGGTDMSYFGLQTANTTNLWKNTPRKIFLDARNQIGDDFPPATYYFDHRRRPIQTSAFGNVQLTFFPLVVSAPASQLLLGYEYFAQMNVLTQAGSIQN